LSVALGRHRLAPALDGPCRCGAEATRTLGRFPHCEDCADDVIERCRMLSAPEGVGVGVPGLARSEYGRRAFDLRCSLCGAGWVGAAFEPCWWCERALARLQADQRERLLWPELPDREDRHRPAALRSWAGRLARGVRAELITEAEARAAFDRHKRRCSDA